MSRFEQIANVLSNSGWSIEKTELASDCWWAKEIWELRSEWTPKGDVIHLSLLVDPIEEFDHNNVPDNVVWAVGLSKTRPLNRWEAERHLISIKHRMCEATSEVVTLANELRAVN